MLRLVLLSLLAATAGCTSPVPLEGLACPCARGFFCCNGRCVREGSSCRESAEPDAANLNDAPRDDATGADVARDAEPDVARDTEPDVARDGGAGDRAADAP